MEIYGESGNLQVTGSGGVGYGLSATGAVTLVSDNASHPQPMVVATVTVTGTNPVFSYKATGNICVARTTVNGSTFTYSLRAQSNQPIGLQYWIFDSATAATKDPTMAGIVAEFRDEFGVLTFDATMAAMRVVNVIETDKTPATVPFGGVASIGDTTSITVPSGKVYAIVQATPSFVFTTYDNGGYSSSQQAPQDLGIGLENEPGPGTRWRTQTLESFQATGGYNGSNTIRVGLSRFEYFNLGWVPVDSEPFINVWGQPRHLIIDVTNFTSAGPINPTVVNGSVNATSRSVTTGGASTITQSVTQAVTATASGGSGSYSYLWERVTGSTSVVANGSSTSASFSTSTLNQPQNSTRSAVWRCRITDSNGVVGYAPEVTFNHVASAYTAPDPHPDTLNWGNISQSSTAQTVWADTVELTVTGITQAITLRGTITGASGSATNGELEVWKNGSRAGGSTTSNDGSWTEVTVVNGDQVSWRGYITTDSGVKTRAYTVTVTNRTASTTIDTFTVNLTADSDNNYNVSDPTPNALNWSNASQTSNDPTVWADTNVLTISGINQTIAIRGTISSTTGTSTQGELEIWKNGVWAGGSTNDGNGSWCQANFVNGDQVMFRGYIVSPSGRRTRNYSVTATNQTTGATLDTFTVALVADNDNNHNVVDQSANPISLSDQTVSTNSDTAYTAGTYFQITGINQAITLSFTRDSLTQSGNAFTRRTVIGHSTNGGSSYAEFSLGAGTGASVTRTANNGDWFFIKGYLDTTAGTASAQWRNHVTNATTGEYLGSAWVYMTVDANNDFNIAPAPSVSLTTTYLAPDHNFTNQGVNATTYTDTTTAVVSGGQGPLTYQWERTSGLSTWVIANPNSLTTSFRYTARTNYTAEASFRLKVTDALGRVAYSPEVYCYVSAGNILS